MTEYGTLRVWAAAITLVGMLGIVSALAGTLVWAIEVDGFWPTVGVLLVGGAGTILLTVLTLALAQALRALADIGDTVNAR